MGIGEGRKREREKEGASLLTSFSPLPSQPLLPAMTDDEELPISSGRPIFVVVVCLVCHRRDGGLASSTMSERRTPARALVISYERGGCVVSRGAGRVAPPSLPQQQPLDDVAQFQTC